MTDKSINLLVVDDDPIICQLIADTFSTPEFHVLKARDGVEALRQIADSPDAIDVLLLDVVMPKMDGAELTRVILSWHPAIKIIFMSGYPDEVIALYGIPAHQMRYIKKPFTLNILVQTVREVLNR
jgi:two-component system cell cycle sensor histidine kinase/response regulator CckA